MTGKIKVQRLLYEIGGGYVYKSKDIDLITSLPLELLGLTVNINSAYRSSGVNKNMEYTLLENVVCTIGKKKQLSDEVKFVRLEEKLYRVSVWKISRRVNNAVVIYTLVLQEVYIDKDKEKKK